MTSGPAVEAPSIPDAKFGMREATLASLRTATLCKEEGADLLALVLILALAALAAFVTLAASLNWLNAGRPCSYLTIAPQS